MIRCFIFAIPDLDFPIFSELNIFLDVIALNLPLLNPSSNLDMVHYSGHSRFGDFLGKLGNFMNKMQYVFVTKTIIVHIIGDLFTYCHIAKYVYEHDI